MDSVGEEEEDAEVSVKDQLLSLVARVVGLKKKNIKVEERRPQTAS